MRKKLVAYFSASQTTKKIAEIIAQVAEGDLYEIIPKQPYSKADLNWMDKKSRSSVEMSNKKFRTEISDTDIQVDKYDEIILRFTHSAISCFVALLNTLPSIITASGADGLSSLTVFPNPLPPEVANNTIFLPVKS